MGLGEALTQEEAGLAVSFQHEKCPLISLVGGTYRFIKIYLKKCLFDS